MDEFIALSREIEEKTGYKTNLCYNQNEQFLEYFLRADDIVLYQDGKMGGESAEPYVNFFKLYEDGIKDGWVVDPSVFAERTIGSVEQDPLVYGSTSFNTEWEAVYLSVNLCGLVYTLFYPLFIGEINCILGSKCNNVSGI